MTGNSLPRESRHDGLGTAGKPLSWAGSPAKAGKGQPMAVVNRSVLGIDAKCLFSWFRGMARKLRVEYPWALYHVVNRGERREVKRRQPPAVIGRGAIKHEFCRN